MGNMLDFRIYDIYIKIKQGIATDEERMLYEFELGKSCWDRKSLETIMNLKKKNYKI